MDGTLSLIGFRSCFTESMQFQDTFYVVIFGRERGLLTGPDLK